VLRSTGMMLDSKSLAQLRATRKLLVSKGYRADHLALSYMRSNAGATTGLGATMLLAALTSNFILTLVMVLKRMFILLHKELQDEPVGDSRAAEFARNSNSTSGSFGALSSCGGAIGLIAWLIESSHTVHKVPSYRKRRNGDQPMPFGALREVRRTRSKLEIWKSLPRQESRNVLSCGE
jgi:hypothetical protein